MSRRKSHLKMLDRGPEKYGMIMKRSQVISRALVGNIGRFIARS